MGPEPFLFYPREDGVLHVVLTGASAEGPAWDPQPVIDIARLHGARGIDIACAAITLLDADLARWVLGLVRSAADIPVSLSGAKEAVAAQCAMLGIDRLVTIGIAP